ncbi:MAG: putative hemolysin [Gammaproteobacteria bacterium]|jgi:putative hemolysin
MLNATPARPSRESVIEMATKLQRANFSVQPYLPKRLGPLQGLAGATIDRLLGLRKLADFYYGFDADLAPATLAREVIAGLGVKVSVDPRELDLVPTSGPCIVVSNHPHGMLDGLIVMDLLARIRPDFRVMANHFLARFTQLQPLFFQVDPFGGKAAIRRNIATARQASNWLEDGKLLMIFPGGEVSSLSRTDWRITDPKWDEGVARFAEKSGAPVVPLHIGGHNSASFQLSGLLHPSFRTALLVREMMNKQGSTIDIRVGREISSKTLESLDQRGQITRYLRTKTYLLKEKGAQNISLGPRPNNARPAQEIAPVGEIEDFRNEISTLPADQQLLTNGAFEVYYATADQIPKVLQEIGRLRELSFRAVGEGTGKSSDVDLYDNYYTHLFIWDSKERNVVGGYRLGRTDKIIDKFGIQGLYVDSLFKLSPELTSDLRCALELGRSFIRIEYQRSYSSLMMLWKGIGRYLLQYPQYRILFGPLSISNDYHPISQDILVQFLRQKNATQRRASHVKPRRPFRQKSEMHSDLIDLDSVDLDIISDLLSTVESDDKGVPVLLRQYLKFGGHILGFNIDPNFNNAIDCLLWCDLMETESRLLSKYMGSEAAEDYRRVHESVQTDEPIEARSKLAG